MLDPEGHKQKTARNREESKKILEKKGIGFLLRNNGAHLIVQHNNQIVDFWPGTGKFIFRTRAVEGRGVFNLIQQLEGRARYDP